MVERRSRGPGAGLSRLELGHRRRNRPDRTRGQAVCRHRHAAGTARSSPTERTSIGKREQLRLPCGTVTLTTIRTAIATPLSRTVLTLGAQALCHDAPDSCGWRQTVRRLRRAADCRPDDPQGAAAQISAPSRRLGSRGWDCQEFCARARFVTGRRIFRRDNGELGLCRKPLTRRRSAVSHSAGCSCR